jgi:hypothetical protein
MSENKVVCNKACTCKNTGCRHSEPHKAVTEIHDEPCTTEAMCMQINEKSYCYCDH